MSSSSAANDRLRISHLMLLTAGISVAFFVARGIEKLRFAADAHFYGLEYVSDVDAMGMLVAAVYGLCVAMFVMATKSGDFWSSPGKTLSLLFATMCLLHWSLDFVAAIITSSRIQSQLPPGTVDERGYILGIWYRNFAVEIGYAACLPILLWVIYKSKDQGIRWRLAWIGFLFFSLAIAGYVHLGHAIYMPRTLRTWYFEVAMGIPVCLLFVGFVMSLAQKQAVDWWTTMTVMPICLIWCVGVVLKVLA